mgnify:CR=1 FL=1
MISNDTLRDVQGYLMDAMTALYVEDRDDDLAKSLAAVMVGLWEDIDIELIERIINVSDADR